MLQQLYWAIEGLLLIPLQLPAYLQQFKLTFFLYFFGCLTLQSAIGHSLPLLPTTCSIFLSKGNFADFCFVIASKKMLLQSY